MPHSSLVSAEIARYLDAYRTCELLTVSKSGVPIAWPTSGILDPESGTFLISTSIGYPQKAYNIRRNPSVALLFSDPTGSGLDAPPQVLIQGTADCPDEIVTSFAANAALWQRLLTIQPSGKLYSSTALTRHLMDVYYMRLLITVTPTEITTARALDTLPPLTLPATTPADAVVARAARLARGFRSAALCAFDGGDGRPTIVRVTPEFRDASLLLPVPADRPLTAGPASLLFHRHDEKVGAMMSFVLTGTIEAKADGHVFRIDRIVPGQKPVGPMSALRVIRELRTTAAGYLERRGLPRPQIAWDELGPIKAAIREQTKG